MSGSLGWAGPIGAALALLWAAPGAAAVAGTDLVSRATGAAGVAANGSTDSVTRPAVSSGGRYVAFQSRATNLDPADTDTVADIYVRDTQAHTTRLVSRATSEHNFGSDPSISADGRYVAFDSQHAIYRRDLQSGTTVLASRATGAAGAPGTSNSFEPSISPSGRYIAFESQAVNLDAADTSIDTDIYVRDLVANTTALASRASGAAGAKANDNSGMASMSDAPAVAYETPATNLDPADTGPAGFDIFVRDLTANTTTVASRANGAAGAKGDTDSRWPSISADGSRMAFESQATNLVAADGDGIADIFVRGLAVGSTTLASVASSGVKGNNASHLAALSPDGHYVAFESAASNLGSSALNRQIFIRAVDAAPGAGGTGAGGAGGGGAVGAPGGGGGTGAGPSAPARARFASRRSVRVKKKGKFAFAFRATPGLTGRITLKSAKKVRVGAKRKKLRLARRSFSVPAGGEVKLRLKLARAHLRILRKSHRLKTKVAVTLTNGAGLSSTARTTITLKR